MLWLRLRFCGYWLDGYGCHRAFAFGLQLDTRHACLATAAACRVTAPALAGSAIYRLFLPDCLAFRLVVYPPDCVTPGRVTAAPCFCLVSVWFLLLVPSAWVYWFIGSSLPLAVLPRSAWLITLLGSPVYVCRTLRYVPLHHPPHCCRTATHHYLPGPFCYGLLPHGVTLPVTFTVERRLDVMVGGQVTRTLFGWCDLVVPLFYFHTTVTFPLLIIAVTVLFWTGYGPGLFLPPCVGLPGDSSHWRLPIRSYAGSIVLPSRLITTVDCGTGWFDWAGLHRATLIGSFITFLPRIRVPDTTLCSPHHHAPLPPLLLFSSSARLPFTCGARTTPLRTTRSWWTLPCSLCWLVVWSPISLVTISSLLDHSPHATAPLRHCYLRDVVAIAGLFTRYLSAVLVVAGTLFPTHGSCRCTPHAHLRFGRWFCC